MRREHSPPPDLRVVWLIAAAALALFSDGEAFAQQAARPIGRFVSLDSPITDDSIGRVRRTALGLQDVAVRERRKAYLILEFSPGQSQFHHVYALSDFLTSPAVSSVTTVAWVPEAISGNNALPALVCNEIVMAPTASLGDLGRGEALPPEQIAIVNELIARGRNRLVTPALAKAMADPSTVLMQLTVETADGQRERKLATAEDAEDLTATGAAVPESQTLKERGAVATFSGEQAQAGGFLATHLAGSRREVAELFNLPAESLHEPAAGHRMENVSVIDVRGSIDTVLGSFLQRQISRAVESGADLIIFEIHSPGGHLEEVHDLALAIAALEDQKVQTVAWIPELAIGEAAIIALGCDQIYLTPEAKIGAAAGRRRFDLQDSPQGERAFLLKTMEELADRKDRPVAVLRAMVEPQLPIYRATNRDTGEVTWMTEEQLDQLQAEWIRGPLAPESGDGYLTADGRSAQQLLIAESPVEDFSELKQRLGLAPDFRPMRVQRTWVDDLVFTLNRPVVTGMLFTLALICIYLEMHFMTGLLGIISTLCFALFFWSRFLGGTAGGLEIILFLIGLSCLAAEMFLLPGFGVFGISGMLMVVASLVMASQTFGSIETGRDLSQATGTLKTISVSIIAVIGTAVLLNRFLPRLPFLSDMILTPPGASDVDGDDLPRLRPDVAAGPNLLLGAAGITTTVLRPAGKARIQGRLWDVVSQGGYIGEGQEIEVVSVTGNHVVVREA
jgi:membrane-bound serine protease (ClpP class)